MKEKAYRLVIFDWEGTLSDTLGLVLNCVRTEAQLLNLGTFNEAKARQYVDLGLVNTVKKVFSHSTVEQQNALLDAVQCKLMRQHGQTYLFPGAKELVQSIHHANIKLAIASNKSQLGLQRALERSGLNDYFPITRSASTCSPKPDPEMVNQILDEFKIAACDAVMIGDSTIDMEMAKKINMDAIGVNFYHKIDSNLSNAGAKIVFDNYDALADFLHLPLIQG